MRRTGKGHAVKREEITEEPRESGELLSVGDNDITIGSGFTLFVASAKLKYQAGMPYELWGESEWGPVRGLTINGEVLWYRTSLQQRVYEAAERHTNEAQRLREWLETGEAKQDAIYESLPPEFQALIRHRRAENEIEYRAGLLGEDYEGFALVDAVKLHKHAGGDPELIEVFSQLPHGEKEKHFPDMQEGHSGGTFVTMMSFAYALASDPQQFFDLDTAGK